jgi:DNA-binding NtrC family response regulator
VYEHRAIAQALWQGRGSIADAAKILKCSPQTIWVALELTPMLREIVSDCDGLIFDIAYQTLCHYLEIGDLSASIFMLRRLWPKYGHPDVTGELKGADLAPIKKNSVDPEDLRGKPKVYTDEVIAHALLQGRGIVSEAAKILKCCRRTICEAIGQRPMLGAIMWQCESRIFDLAYGNLWHYVEIGNLKASIFMLELLRPEFD